MGCGTLLWYSAQARAGTKMGSLHHDGHLLICRRCRRRVVVVVQVVVRGRLSAHLRALRDYALLAKGNFYSNFIQESHELMLKPPNLFSTRDVNYGPFATAAASSGVADDPHFRNCRLTLDLSEFVYRAFSPHSVALLHVRFNCLLSFFFFSFVFAPDSFGR